MPRPKDNFFWKYVEKTSEGSICNFCGKLFRGNPSISRIRYHILGTQNRGICVCERVPDDAKHEARLYADEAANKRQKSMPSSSNTVENQPRVPGITARDQQIGGGQFWSHVERGNRTGSTPYLLELLDEGGGFLEDSATELHKTEGIEFMMTVPVGQKFRENKDQLWSWLMDDDVSSIGICGMGGVGKTELAKHINNELILTPNPFLHVHWVGISRDLSIIGLQNSIAEVLGLSLSSSENEDVRAAKLRKAFVEKKKSVLILDNVWNVIEYRRIGIPLTCKLIFTTRCLDVCERTGCQNVIKVDLLNKGEDWELFQGTLGSETTLDSPVRDIARSVVEKCGGLPLGIIKIGINMRKKVNIAPWRLMLEELQQSRPRQDIAEVFKTLKMSYNFLNDSNLQQSFLSCALHEPKPDQILFGNRMELLKNLVIGGISGIKSGRRELEKAHDMLLKLENASLYDSASMHMHPLLRIMAFQIMKESERSIIVVSNQQVKEFPTEEGWTTDIRKVILINTAIKKITLDHSPGCPDLSVMLLCCNSNLEFIHDAFFQHFCGLRFLDLSCTAIKKLPNSVSNLVNLISLSVRGCSRLTDMPSLKKLTALEKVDMSRSGVTNVPDGMELLCNLNYLDLRETMIRTIPDGMLFKLSKLMLFKTDVFVKGEELARLTNLETLICSLGVLSSFNTYMKTLNTRQVDTFFFIFGDAKEYGGIMDGYELIMDMDEFGPTYDRCMILYNCHGGHGGEDAIYLPTNIQYFRMYSSNGRSLCLEGNSELKYLYIEASDEMVYLTRDRVFESLEILHLRLLKKLHVIFNCDGWPPLGMHLPPNGTFSNLRILSMLDCLRLKNLLPACLLPNLINLEQIRVKRCKLLEEIVASDQQPFSLPTEAVPPSCLPKLKILWLKHLPKLKSICCKKLICISLQELVVVNCPNLNNIPLSLPINSLEKVQVYPEDWWKRVEWENPNAKALVPVTIMNRRKLFD